MHTVHENRIYSELKRHAQYVIICGFGRVGQHIARQLSKDQLHFVIIDMDDKNVLQAKQQGYLVIQADASNNEVLIQAGIRSGATAVFCTTSNDVVNVYITLTSRNLCPTIRIISRANQESNVKKLYQAGASDVIQPFAIAAMAAAEYIGQPVAFDAIQGILRQENQSAITGFTVAPESVLIDKTLAEIEFEQRKLILIGVFSSHEAHQRHKNRYEVNHQQLYFNPVPHFVLQEGDILVLIGRNVSIENFQNRYVRKKRK
jgi:voltage-gated potassium channel